MVWKEKEEFIKAGNMIVWAGLLLFALGLFLALYGSVSDLILTYLMTSAQTFGIGSFFIGSVIFLIGRMREARSVGTIRESQSSLTVRRAFWRTFEQSEDIRGYLYVQAPFERR